MKSKNTVTFDKLDHQCFDELPLLVDVITSTLNKIGTYFSSFHQDIETIIKKELKGKRGWNIKNSNNKLFYPFNFDGRRELTYLQSYIDTSNGINIVKQHGSTIKNRFWISSGLHYENTGGENDKYFHFSIARDEYDVKIYGVLNSKSFYRDLEKKLKGYNWEIWHPDVEGTYEEIYLWCDELDADKLNDYYKRFKTDIVIPYIKNLE